MSRYSHIGWTSHTWNCVLGCDKVSAGCTDCFAARDAYRHGHNPAPPFAPYEGRARSA